MVRSRLLLRDDIVTLDPHILATFHKDSIRLAQELITPKEQLVSHHVFDNTRLVSEHARSFRYFHRVVDLKW